MINGANYFTDDLLDGFDKKTLEDIRSGINLLKNVNKETDKPEQIGMGLLDLLNEEIKLQLMSIVETSELDRLRDRINHILAK